MSLVIDTAFNKAPGGSNHTTPSATPTCKRPTPLLGRWGDYAWDNFVSAADQDEDMNASGGSPGLNAPGAYFTGDAAAQSAERGKSKPPTASAPRSHEERAADEQLVSVVLRDDSAVQRDRTASPPSSVARPPVDVPPRAETATPPPAAASNGTTKVTESPQAAPTSYQLQQENYPNDVQVAYYPQQYTHVPPAAAAFYQQSGAHPAAQQMPNGYPHGSAAPPGWNHQPYYQQSPAAPNPGYGPRGVPQYDGPVNNVVPPSAGWPGQPAPLAPVVHAAPPAQTATPPPPTLAAGAIPVGPNGQPLAAPTNQKLFSYSSQVTQISRFPPPPPPSGKTFQTLLREGTPEKVAYTIALRWYKKVLASQPAHTNVSPCPEPDFTLTTMDEWVGKIGEWWKVNYAGITSNPVFGPPSVTPPGSVTKRRPQSGTSSQPTSANNRIPGSGTGSQPSSANNRMSGSTSQPSSANNRMGGSTSQPGSANNRVPQPQANMNNGGGSQPNSANRRTGSHNNRVPQQQN